MKNFGEVMSLKLNEYDNYCYVEFEKKKKRICKRLYFAQIFKSHFFLIESFQYAIEVFHISLFKKRRLDNVGLRI